MRRTLQVRSVKTQRRIVHAEKSSFISTCAARRQNYSVWLFASGGAVQSAELGECLRIKMRVRKRVRTKKMRCRITMGIGATINRSTHRRRAVH